MKRRFITPLVLAFFIICAISVPITVNTVMDNQRENACASGKTSSYCEALSARMQQETKNLDRVVVYTNKERLECARAEQGDENKFCRILTDNLEKGRVKLVSE